MTDLPTPTGCRVEPVAAERTALLVALELAIAAAREIPEAAALLDDRDADTLDALAGRLAVRCDCDACRSRVRLRLLRRSAARAGDLPAVAAWAARELSRIRAALDGPDSPVPTARH